MAQIKKENKNTKHTSLVRTRTPFFASSSTGTWRFTVRVVTLAKQQKEQNEHKIETNQKIEIQYRKKANKSREHNKNTQTHNTETNQSCMESGRLRSSSNSQGRAVSCEHKNKDLLSARDKHAKPKCDRQDRITK